MEPSSPAAPDTAQSTALPQPVAPPSAPQPDSVPVKEVLSSASGPDPGSRSHSSSVDSLSLHPVEIQPEDALSSGSSHGSFAVTPAENGAEILGQCMDLVNSLEQNTDRDEPPRAGVDIELNMGASEPMVDEKEKPDTRPAVSDRSSRADRVRKYKEIVYSEENMMLQGTFLRCAREKKKPVYSNLKLNNRHGKLYWEVLTAIKSIGSENSLTKFGTHRPDEGLSSEITAASLRTNSILKPICPSLNTLTKGGLMEVFRERRESVRHRVLERKNELVVLFPRRSE